MPALPNISRGAGIRRIFAVSDRKNTIPDNGYISGAGVGAVSTANRRALRRRAVLTQEIDASGNLVGKTCGCYKLPKWMTGTLTDDNIHNYVNLWTQNPSHPVFTEPGSDGHVGHIEQWDTSQVTNMSSLFMNKTSFNDNISRWDVSSVTNMESMFHGATNFNQTFIYQETLTVEGWDTSSVTSMKNMFNGATSFNAGVTTTLDSQYRIFSDVTSVTTMEGMFQGATSFNGGGDQTITTWTPNSCINFNNMFNGATVMGTNGLGQQPQSLHTWSDDIPFTSSPTFTNKFQNSGYRTSNHSGYIGVDTPSPATDSTEWSNLWSLAP